MLISSRYVGVILLMAFLSGCASLGQSHDVSLNITGVDYAGTGMDAYQVKDPDNPKNRGGGFSIRPYSADGVQCCYTVPKEWHPGLKATVLLRYPLEGTTHDEISASLAKRQAEGTLVETYQVEIPRYTTPAKGTLWVQFLPNKHVNLVVSDLDPSHKDFPGKVKGWPVPSVEYRRKLIDARMLESQERLERSKDLLDAVISGDISVLKRNWGYYKDISPEEISNFKSYLDPNFKSFFIKNLRWRITKDEQTITDLRRRRP